MTLVAHVDTSGHVGQISPGRLDGYRAGLRRVRSARDARLVAAAVMILSSCDPRERRWKLDPALFKVKKRGRGWVCWYEHGDVNHRSQVTFDRSGALSGITDNAPPVP